jgi:hypothetical protein
MTRQIDKDAVRTIAEAGDWKISDERAGEIAGVFQPLQDDTRALRGMELGDSVPGAVFEADR